MAEKGAVPVSDVFFERPRTRRAPVRAELIQDLKVDGFYRHFITEKDLLTYGAFGMRMKGNQLAPLLASV